MLNPVKSGRIKNLYISGMSIAEVAKEIKMSSSGVRYQLRKENVVIRNRSVAVRIKHHKRLRSYSAILPKKIPKSLTTLYFIALALYWGEGSKTGNTVAIANSDPYIILTFLSFLRKICKVDNNRLHILIHYHPDQDENELISYWSSLTNIKASQFYKSTIHNTGKKHSTKSIKFGTISLRYADSLLQKEIMARIEALKDVNKSQNSSVGRAIVL